MSVTHQLRIAELDYDQILANLIEFLKADETFSDYDFSGSGLRLIARVLAYVTFYQSHYLTAAANEAFLDTAQLRQSVVAHARMLGYRAKSTQSATFTTDIAVEVANTNAQFVTLPRLTQFALTSNSAFTFYNLQDVVLSKNTASNLFETTNIELVEGTPYQYRFTVNLTDPTQRFVIPNADIDVRTLNVRVQASLTSNVIQQFSPADSHLTITGTTPAFFIQESYDGLQELKFGNGVIGLPLTHGNIVIVDCLVSKGDAANGLIGPFKINATTLDGFVRGGTTTTSDTVPSMGGAPPESLEDIRFLAPLSYQAQNRCVTVEDYKAAILDAYGEYIGAINVFGGEEGNPNDALNRPIYGRVFIALKPKIGLRFTDTIRENIEQRILRPKSIVGVVPEVIDPDYTFLNVRTSVRYDPKNTTRSRLQLQDAIRENILSYVRENIEKFDTSFRFSRFVRVIDSSDDAVLSSQTRIELEKRVYPRLGESNRYILKFNAPLRRNSDGSSILEETSHRFTYTNDNGETQDKCFLFEQNGSLHVAYRDAAGNIIILQTNIGTVDVALGLVTITNFIPVSIENDAIYLRLRVVPQVNDFTPRLNQLFSVDADSGIFIQLLNDTLATTADEDAFFNGGLLP